jgi:trimethylamine--corrinoid protein Co-methyltransferase
MAVVPRLSLLQGADTTDSGWCEKVHAQSLRVLAEVGVRVDSDKALQIFASCPATRGAIHVDPATRIAKFSREVVDWALRVAPRTIEVYKRPVIGRDEEGALAFRLGDGGAQFGAGVTTLGWQDPEEPRRITAFTRENMVQGVRLANGLAGLDFVSTLGVVQDVPEGTSGEMVGVLEMVANTAKPLVLLISEEDKFTQALDMLQHLVPGKGQQKKRPWHLVYVNPHTPLVINKTTVDKLVEAIGRGIPVIYSSYGMAGATMPITVAGELAMLNAELLAGLVLCQLIREGASVVMGACPVWFDMKAMTPTLSIQASLINLASTAMLRSYHIPHVGLSGCSYGFAPDASASTSHWLTHLSALLHGSSGLLPFLGCVIHATAWSPAAAVLANDVILQAKNFCEGFTIRDEDFLLEEIKEVGPGGNFLTTPATMAQHKMALNWSKVFPNVSVDTWKANGCPLADDLLKKETLRLLKTSKPPADHDVLIALGEKFISSAH